MASICFLHTSDIHAGKPFGQYGGDVRGLLRQARIDVIERLATIAREKGVGHILLAGDTFDVETPAPADIRQPLSIMASFGDVRWWVLPGNHDSLRADVIWDAFDRDAPSNVHVLKSAEPVEMEENVWLLPAPCPRRFPASDPSLWMDECMTPEGALRIGLAHGGVTDFGGSESDGAGVVSPDRARQARLDYLALGDWHGKLRVNGRTWYSGAPERDRFKHDGRGVCLLVEIAASGAVPKVTDIPTGCYDWRDKELNLSPSLDAVEAFRELLPGDRGGWRHCLLRVRATGHIHMQERARLLQAVQEMEPEFLVFDWDDSALVTEFRPGDLDAIAEGGALRVAATTLEQAALDADAAREDRDIASAARSRRYSLVREVCE